MSIAVTFPDATVWQALLEPEQARQYYFVKRDWERSDFSGEITRPNLPCVFRCGEILNSTYGHYTELSKEWQFCIMDMAALIVYGRYHFDLTDAEYDWLAGKVSSVFSSAVAFCNNDNGLDVRRNYLQGINLTAGLPRIYTLVCGGASLSGEVVVNSKGIRMLKVDYFDASKPPPDVRTIDPYTDPRVFFATTITGIKVGTGYKVFRFPQYDGKDVPVPLIASQPIYYPVSDTTPYQATVKRTPYYP